MIRKFKLVTLILFITASLSVQAKDLTAREIMQQVYDRDDGNNAITEMEMVLVDKNGNKRVRNVKSFRRDAGKDGEDTQSIMFFVTPADVKDTGFLTYDYDDDAKDDDQWLYLPALKKTKRIASSDKSSSFMGTDFTYSDGYIKISMTDKAATTEETRKSRASIVLIDSSGRVEICAKSDSRPLCQYSEPQNSESQN